MSKHPQSIAAVLAGLVLVLSSCAAAEGPPKERALGPAAAPECSITGAKLLASGLSDAALCARFMAPVRQALPARAAVQIALAVSPKGTLRAKVLLSRSGLAPQQLDQALAISDRGGRVEDLDQLAQAVAAAIAASGAK